MSELENKCMDYLEGWEENVPGYALLLKGKWGCGKTHYINKFIESYNGDGLIWYISLFGVNKKEELDDKMFEAAHPIIMGKESKGIAALTFSVVRGAVNNKFKVDIKDYTDPIMKFIKSGEEDGHVSGCKAIVFDDVERMGLGIKEFFGYIEELLKGIGIILIANEEEINDEKYVMYKEKIIGEEYNIEPAFEEALNSFWNEEKDMYKGKNWKKFSQKIINDIGIINLRAIRQTIHQWCILYKNIPEKIKKDEEYLDMLFEAFMVLNMQYKIDNYKGYDNEKKSFGEIVKDVWSSYAKTKKNRVRLDITSSLKNDSLVYELPCETSWNSFIKDGKYINSEWTKGIIEDDYCNYLKVKEIRNKNDDELIKTNNYIEELNYKKNNDFDLKANFEKISEKFLRGEYKKFEEIIRYVRIYCFLLEKEVLPQKYSDEYLCNMIDKLCSEQKKELEKVKIDYEQWKVNNPINNKRIQETIKKYIREC